MQENQEDMVIFWHGLTERQVREWEKKSFETGESAVDFMREMVRRKIERQRQAELAASASDALEAG